LGRSEELFRLLVEGIPDYAVFMLDPEGRVLSWSAGARSIQGYEAEEVVGEHFSRFYAPEDVERGRPEQGLRAAEESGRYEEEGWRVRKDGSRFWAGVLITALRDEGGALIGFSSAVRDVTGRKRDEEMTRFLSEASDVLFASLGYHETLASVAELAVPFLADWCAVDVLAEDGSPERVAVVHRDPGKAALARELRERYPPDPNASAGLARALRTGEAEVVPEVPDSLLEAIARDDEHRRVLDGLGLRSYVVAPLTARGRTFGALTLVMAESGRSYGAKEFELAKELSRRAAVAADNARLHEEAQRELSERRRVQDELRRQSDLYETLLQAQSEVGEGFVIAEGPRIFYANEAFCEISGYTERELLELPTFFELFLPEERSAFLERFERRMGGGEGESHQEITLRRKDGRAVDLEIAVKESRTEGVPRFVIVARDVTERKRAGEALRQSEERYRAVVEQAAEGIFLVDPTTKRFLEANAEYQRMLGYTSEELLGMTLYDVVAHEREDIDEKFRRSLEERSFVIGERRHRRKDGSLIDVIANSSLVFYGGRQVVCYVVHDITERKRFEEELEARAEELARSNAELEQFAYIASHDLQEPLRMVSSYTQLLARRYKGKLDEDADEFISYAVDGATRMQTLINDLLSYSRVGTRGKKLAPTDLRAVFEAACNNLRVAIEESGATVVAGALPAVMGDDTQLVQLLQNLIGNSIKFRSVRPPEVRVEAGRRGREWVVSVRDNGVGFERQYADRIFVIFQRLHTRGEYAGTGIGLAVCKKIVERHGGRIWAESEPGEGSTFYFTLPAEGGEPG